MAISGEVPTTETVAPDKGAGGSSVMLNTVPVTVEFPPLPDVSLHAMTATAKTKTAPSNHLIATSRWSWFCIPRASQKRSSFKPASHQTSAALSLGVGLRRGCGYRPPQRGV
jgi:hypothetical protein